MSNKVKVEPADIDLFKLKKLLKYGDIKRIAENTGHSHGYVAQVLNPKMKNKFMPDIVIAAVDMVKNKAKIELDAETASQLTKSST